MKIKNKGKVHPSAPPPPSSSSSVNGDRFLSVLKLLPAAVQVLVSTLSAEDREVLAYLISRSPKTTTIASTAVSACGNSRNPSSAAAAASTPSSSSSSSSMSRNSNKKKKKSGKKGRTHNSPEFDCDCFDCYTSYWLRWDSSPNRELIHQVIEAFEDHPISGEASVSPSQKSKKSNGRGKKKEKPGRRGGDKPKPVEPSTQPNDSAAEITVPEALTVLDEVTVMPPSSSQERLAGEGEDAIAERGEEEVARDTPESSSAVVRAPAETERRGLARNVLVLSFLNSRLWNLWNPNA